MFIHAIKFVQSLDRRNLSLTETLGQLRKLTLDEFAEVLASLPNEDLPHLSSILPAMAPDSVQQEWTGSSGTTLLKQSISFMSFMSSTFTEFSQKPMRQSRVLDFGCGWGRLLRLLAYFNDPQYNFGCDAWEISLRHARDCNMERLANLVLSDEVPKSLPLARNSFDLVYAFSIFTHLSRVSATACLGAIRKVIKNDGIAIISVRPLEFWDVIRSYPPDKAYPEKLIDTLIDTHLSGRMAFTPVVGQIGLDREVHFGDASIPIEAIEHLFPGWTILRAGNTFVDPYQIFVVLRAI